MANLAASDLLVPLGMIDGALFYPSLSSGDVTARLNAYLTAGYAVATAGYTLAALTPTQEQLDAIARDYTYYRAWNEVVMRMTAAPASAALEGEGSSGFLQTQYNEWILARDAWKASYISLIPPAAGTSTPVTAGVTTSVPNTFVF